MAAKWLRQVAIPHVWGRSGTVLTGTFNQDEAALLEALAVLLDRKATRKRSKGLFVAQISIEQAGAFSRAVSPALSSALHHPLCRFVPVPLAYRMAVTVFAKAMIDAGKVKKRGRPWLSAAEVAVRASGEERSINDVRHMKRLAARQRRDAVHRTAEEVWFREITSRGETILTATTGARKI